MRVTPTHFDFFKKTQTKSQKQRVIAATRENRIEESGTDRLHFDFFKKTHTKSQKQRVIAATRGNRIEESGTDQLQPFGATWLR
jgi:hypothetical protein